MYAQPSFVEGIPNAVIEALIDGVPCVATNVGGFPKIVDDNVSGILVSKGNTRQLGKALGRILDSKDLGTRLVLSVWLFGRLRYRDQVLLKRSRKR